jgi:hypothetical protein
MNAVQIQARNEELQAQFQRCETWNDADQWDALGAMYFNAGYVLNAGVCFKRADACRQAEKAIRDWQAVDALIEQVFRRKPRFTKWDIALVLKHSTQARMEACVEVAHKILRQARRDGVVEILERRSHYYRLADGVAMETAGAA